MSTYLEYNNSGDLVATTTIGGCLNPGEGEILFGLLEGSKIKPLEAIEINNNIYVKFNTKGVIGLKMTDDLPEFLWILKEGEHTIKKNIKITIDDINPLSLLKKFNMY
jgi:uncharacterized protein YuzE